MLNNPVRLHLDRYFEWLSLAAWATNNGKQEIKVNKDHQLQQFVLIITYSSYSMNFWSMVIELLPNQNHISIIIIIGSVDASYGTLILLFQQRRLLWFLIWSRIASQYLLLWCANRVLLEIIKLTVILVVLHHSKTFIFLLWFKNLNIIFFS